LAYFDDPSQPEDVFQLANKDETAKAIDAVQAGLASKEQTQIASRAAKQAGSTGNDARAAFKGEKTWRQPRSDPELGLARVRRGRRPGEPLRAIIKDFLKSNSTNHRKLMTAAAQAATQQIRSRRRDPCPSSRCAMVEMVRSSVT